MALSGHEATKFVSYPISEPDPEIGDSTIIWIAQLSFDRSDGIGREALEAYEAEMRPAAEKMILTNRSAGPDHIMQIVEEQCAGVFDDITDVIAQDELDDFAAGYKKTAGLAIAELNASPPILEDGLSVGPRQ